MRKGFRSWACYSGAEKLPGSIRAAYTYFKGSPRDDGAKLSHSRSHPQGVKTVQRG